MQFVAKEFSCKSSLRVAILKTKYCHVLYYLYIYFTVYFYLFVSIYALTDV